MTGKKSWGHRINLSEGNARECSAPVCGKQANYSLTFYVEHNKTRTLHYCLQHIRAYAFSAGLHVPGDLESLNLNKFLTSELQALLSRIEQELLWRSTPQNNTEAGRLGFYFEGVGKKGTTESAYVAALYFKEGRLCRFFYNFKEEDMGEGIVKRYGRYTCRAGDIVEKRFFHNGVLQWLWYLVESEELEIPIAEYGDEARKAVVLKYLRELVPKSALY